MKFVNDMSVGYHNTGHHNLGIKIPPKTQNTIKQPGQRSHPGAVPSSMLARSILCRPKAHGVQCHHLCLDVQILSRFQKAQYALGPRSNTGVRLVRDLPSRGTISTSLEGPRRGPWPRVASPPRPRVRGCPRRTGELYPRPSPPRGLGPRRKLHLAREPPR